MLVVFLEKLNALGKKHANACKSLATWKSITEQAH
jgi:mRNA interferase HigB